MLPNCSKFCARDKSAEWMLLAKDLCFEVLNEVRTAITLSREYLFHVMARDECIAFRCSMCGLEAMDATALHKVKMSDDSLARRAYIEKDHMWNRVYSSMSSYAVFEAHNVELRDALADSLHILQPPDSIMHPSQNVHNFPQTALLVATFNKHLAQDNATLVVSPGRTAYLLAKIAIATLREDVGVDASVKGSTYVPLGYDAFVKRWLKGAVVLLAARVESKSTRVVDELSRMLVNESNRDDQLIGKRVRGRKTRQW